MSEISNPNGLAGFGSANQELNLLLQQSQQQQPAQPSAFRRILGSVAGMAGNMFAPGLGGALGNLIGGSGGIGIGGAAAASSLAASANAANAANLAASSQVLAAAEQSNQNEEMLELASNLEKAKHDSVMSVIQNIGS